MQAVIAWFRDYWPYAIALVVVAVGASFLFRKAAQSYRAHQKTFPAQESEMRRLVALKEQYYPLTAQAIAAAPKEELLEGTALSIQIPLQKSDDPDGAFKNLSDVQQMIYVLDVFTSDKTAATFFKESSTLLTGRLLPALDLIGLHEFDADMQMLVTMFDENDETTSLDPKKIAAADANFAAGDLLTKIKLRGAEYIQTHTEQFLAKDD